MLSQPVLLTVLPSEEPSGNAPGGSVGSADPQGSPMPTGLLLLAVAGLVIVGTLLTIQWINRKLD